MKWLLAGVIAIAACAPNYEEQACRERLPSTRVAAAGSLHWYDACSRANSDACPSNSSCTAPADSLYGTCAPPCVHATDCPNAANGDICVAGACYRVCDPDLHEIACGYGLFCYRPSGQSLYICLPPQC